MDVKYGCRTNICHSNLDGLSETEVRFDIVHAARICMFLYRVSGCRGGVLDEFARHRCRPHLEYFVSHSDFARLSRFFQIPHRLPRRLFSVLSMGLVNMVSMGILYFGCYEWLRHKVRRVSQ